MSNKQIDGCPCTNTLEQRNVTATNIVSGEQVVVDAAVNYFKDNPHFRRKEYVLDFALENMTPLFSLDALTKKLPFGKYGSLYEHAYHSGSLAQMLSLAALDGDQRRRAHVAKLTRKERKGFWYIAKIIDGLPDVTPLFDQVGVTAQHDRDNLLYTALIFRDDLHEMIFDAMIDDHHIDRRYIQYLVDEGAGRHHGNGSLRYWPPRTLIINYTLHILGTEMNDWFSVSEAQKAIVSKGLASPIRWITPEGCGQFFRRVFSQQNISGEQQYYPGGLLIRKRKANAWIWKVRT